MRDSRFWRVMAVLFLGALFYIGHGMHFDGAITLPSLESSAYASGVTVANDSAEIVLTSSQDGRIVYMWQFYSSKPPKYLGKSEAKTR